MGQIRIPKKIWQTWKTSQVPEKWKTSPTSIKQYMPDWEYHLTTDEDNRKIVADNFPDFLSYYDAFPHPIQRADAVRYVILYKYGGLYLDLDYELQESLEPYLAYGELFFIESSNVSAYLTNSIMASIPGHPIWLAMIEEMKKPVPWWAIGKHLEVMTSTGPGMVDRVAKRQEEIQLYLERNPPVPWKKVIGQKYDYMLLPREKINPYSICDCEYRGGSVLKPLEGQSWVGLDTRVYGGFYCYWPYLLLILGLVIIFGIVLISRHKR